MFGIAINSPAVPDDKTETMTTKLADKLRAQRGAKGLSLDGLAKQAGLSKSYLWELENREGTKPSVDKLQAVAAVLDVDVAFFLDDSIDELTEDYRDKQFFRNYSKLDEPSKERLRNILDALKKSS
jgi:transcriptional regulator with XRE-family HTH domain